MSVFSLSRLLRRAAVAVASASLAIATFAAPAQAAPTVRCGATLTQDTTLTADLVCSKGLTLASGVTLDLGGHRLIGPGGTGTAITAQFSTGNAIVNGSIKYWGTGIYFEGANVVADSPLKLTRVDIVGTPIRVLGADVILDHSTVRSSPMLLSYSALTATHSRLIESSTTGELNVITVQDSWVQGGGLGIDENNSVSVLRSSMNGAGFAGQPVGCDGNLVIADSTIRNYAHPACWFGQFGFITVTNSTFRDNPGGALLADGNDGATITNSTFRTSGDAIVGGFLTVTGSRFVGNATAITVTGFGGAESALTGNVIRNGTGTGIDAQLSGVRIGSNQASGNAGYGIYAPGAVDLGHNNAWSNKQGQCVGVVCG